LRQADSKNRQPIVFGGGMVTKIALEEHFLCPGFEDYWKTTVEDVDPRLLVRVVDNLTDFGERRLGGMEEAGIERAVLSLAGPGVQIERDPTVAARRSREANDFLAGVIQKRPDRYSGFAHLAMQDPAGAAGELERCVNELGFCGAMINGHTNGQYLDDSAFYPFWERAEALGAPIYLHPTDPVAPIPALEGHRGLKRATWEWTFETGTHALRLVFAGLFDRFPHLTVVLGHLGETLPYLLSRFDSRAKLYGVKLSKPPSAYIKENFAVTTSGMFSADPLICSVNALGLSRVMFSADYPFESMKEAADYIEQVQLQPGQREAICSSNAKKLLRLK
jgi:2,3-dihydroxybenzoate decarboxylase